MQMHLESHLPCPCRCGGWMLEWGGGTCTCSLLLYYFDQFGRHTSQSKWIWLKSVACPMSHVTWSQRQRPVPKNHWSEIPKFQKFSAQAALTIGQNFWLVPGHMPTSRW